MVARKATKAAKAGKAGKASRKSALLTAIARTTGISRKDMNEELMLLAKPSRKAPKKKPRKSS